MQCFQPVAEANNPNAANRPQGCRGAEVAGKIQEKANNPNNRNNAGRRRILPFTFFLPSVLGLLGLLYIYSIYIDSYVKNLSAVTKRALGLLAGQCQQVACHG